MISFNTINRYSEVIDENEFFKQYFNSAYSLRYDSNFFQLKYQPSLSEFELIEEMQLQFHEAEGLNHIKFYWPENKGFTPEIVTYFEKENYEIEMLELYAIDPLKFNQKINSDYIKVVPLSIETIADFKRINYPNDLIFGEDFADMKQVMYEDILLDPKIIPYIAYVNDTAAGTLVSILGEETVEIDDLLTINEFRNQGVAAALQAEVMEFAQKKGKQVILLADADDTPREMYIKQNYTYMGYQLGAQKILTK